MNLISEFKKDVKNALSKGAFHILISSIFSQGILFLLGIFMARFLGPEDLGHVRVMQVVLQFADVPADFGMSVAIIKYVSEFQSEQMKRKVLSQGIFFNFFTALIVSIILFFLSQSTNIIRDSVARYYLRFLCWLPPFIVVTLCIICDFQGRKQMRKVAVITIIQQAFSFLIVCSLVYIWMLRGYVVARIVYVIITSLVLLSLAKNKIVLGWDNYIFRKMVRFGSFGMLATIFTTMMSTVDTLCISNILKDAALVGYYGVAITLARGLMIVPNAITRTAFPYLSERSRDFSEIIKQLWRLSKRVALVMSVICGTVFVSAYWIIYLFFGEEYSPSVPVLQVLMPGIFVYSLLNVLGTVIVALGRTDVSFYITLIVGISNVLMNIILINHIGMVGAAWATVLTNTLNMSICVVFFVSLYRKQKKMSIEENRQSRK